jgi:hypothetical protein
MASDAGREKKNRLGAFAGEWVGDEKVAAAPGHTRGGAAVGRTTARMALRGTVLITDYVEERDGKVILEGHGIYAWEARDVYRMYWFDTSGPAPDAPIEGRWVGNTLTFERAAPNGRVRYVYTLHDGGDAYDFRIEHLTHPATGSGASGEPAVLPQVLMEGHYRRA